VASPLGQLQPHDRTAIDRWLGDPAVEVGPPRFDRPGGPGRLFTVLTDGLADYVYKDFSVQNGQNLLFGSLGPGTPTAQLRSPANAALPDLWVPPPFQWATVCEGHTNRDQFDGFYAFVEEKPL
jgi:hypothetical protein